MVMRLLTLAAGIFGEIGPGLLLAALLPFSLIALALVLREVLRRLRWERLPTG